MDKHGPDLRLIADMLRQIRELWARNPSDPQILFRIAVMQAELDRALPNGWEEIP
jgi:hypothetical protein